MLYNVFCIRRDMASMTHVGSFIPTNLPRRVKAKGSSVHSPAIERRVRQIVWRRELKESAPEDVLETLTQVAPDSGR